MKARDAIEFLLKRAGDIIDAEIINALSYLGTQAVNLARNRSADVSWIDHTGNLRSSIGEAVFSHGKEVIRSSFEVVGGGTKGAAVGNQRLNELAERYFETYALVVIAGMEYAEFVERMENKDVLGQAELMARDKIDEYIKKAVDKALRKIDKLMQ